MNQKKNSFQILLVEDEGATRERLRAAVESHPQLVVRASVATFKEAQTELRSWQPDVLLTDLGLPDGSGIDLIASLPALGYSTEAMVITVFGDERHVIQAVEAGATGYLLKDDTAENISAAILELLAGGSPMSPSIARYLLKRFRREAASEPANASPKPQLSERELETLNYVAKGFSYAEISRLMGISEHTIASHLKHIYRKIGVHSRGEAVFEAMQLGLLTTGQ